MTWPRWKSTAAVSAAQLRLTGFCISASSRKRKQIFIRQLVIVRPKLRKIGAQFAGTEGWSLLDVYLVRQEKCQIGAYHKLHNQLPIFNAIELVRTCVVVLIEAHVAQLHIQLLFQAGLSLARPVRH
jgi:hypothetical protein